MSHMSCKTRTLAISFDSDSGSFASGRNTSVGFTRYRFTFTMLLQFIAIQQRKGSHTQLTAHCLRNSHTLEGAHTNANWFHMWRSKTCTARHPFVRSGRSPNFVVRTYHWRTSPTFEASMEQFCSHPSHLELHHQEPEHRWKMRVLHLINTFTSGDERDKRAQEGELEPKNHITNQRANTCTNPSVVLA